MINNNNKDSTSAKDIYETSDLALVTILSLSFPIESVKETNSRRVIFVFKKTQELNKSIESYWRGDLRVEPQQFFNQLTIIKTRIYANQ